MRTSERFSWGTSAAGEFVEGSGLPFDTPKPNADRKTTFIHEITKYQIKIEEKCSINFVFIHSRITYTKTHSRTFNLVKLC